MRSSEADPSSVHRAASSNAADNIIDIPQYDAEGLDVDPILTLSAELKASKASTKQNDSTIDLLRRRIKTLEAEVRMLKMEAGQKNMKLSPFVDRVDGKTKRFCTVCKGVPHFFVGGVRHTVQDVRCYSYVP